MLNDLHRQYLGRAAAAAAPDQSAARKAAQSPISPALAQRIASQARAVEAALRFAPRLDAAILEAVASGAFCGPRYLTPAEVHAPGLPSPAQVAALQAAAARFIEHPAFTRTFPKA